MTYKEAVKKLRLILLTMLSINLYSCSVPDIRTTTLINCVIVVV